MSDEYVNDPAILAALDGPQPHQPVGQGEALVRGAAQGLTGGWGDEGAAAIDAALPGVVRRNIPSWLGGDVTREALPEYLASGKSYDERRQIAEDYYRGRNAEAKKDNPWTYGGAELLAGVAPASKVLGGAGAVKYARAAGLGAGTAAGFSEARDTGGLARDALLGAGVGMAGQKAGDVLGDYLASKLAKASDHQTLVNAGITRGQIRNIAAREGNPQDFEHSLEEMVAAARRHGASWEEVSAAKAAAGEDIAAFHKQMVPEAQGLNFSDVQAAEDAALARLKTAHDAGTRGDILKESDQLFTDIGDGKMTGEHAAEYLQRLRENVYGASGNGIPQGVDATTREAHRQALVEALRENAIAGQAPGGAISPARYTEAVGEYGPLNQLNRLASRNQGAIHGAHNNIPFLNHHGGTATALGGAGALHAAAPVLEGAGLGWVAHAGVPLALGAAGLGAISKSPAALSALSTGAEKLGEAIPKTIPMLADVLAARKSAAKNLASGRTTQNYDPTNPQH